MKGLIKLPQPQIIDLGSGSGGGWFRLNQILKSQIENLKINLSDYFPNEKAFKKINELQENINYITYPVDARDVPENLKGLRTLFLTFHHFNPSDASKILQNAVDQQCPIAIFEGQDRSLKSLFAMFISPITVLLVTPFIRPFKWKRLLFTYLLPIIPLIIWWDGLVSSFRTYSLSEMENLIKNLKNGDQMNWEMAKVKSGPGIIIYLLGLPKR
ncbi:hypothetical protein QWY93_07300 [Echinicola jeungdonensis]|nr:hypothetical protein [Echinicola jeungdonensis]MDN3669130.1 hypothetical protein [Echinicola jeungdonensis]